MNSLQGSGALFTNTGVRGKPVGASMGRALGGLEELESLWEVWEALGIPQGGNLFIGGWGCESNREIDFGFGCGRVACVRACVRSCVQACKRQ